ncbi:hypothetical protein Ciccas_000264 [Cichlidogyrus casuarinus]|uniref:Uncharacterized protein n=1 Tax=Cichlidogyrus casuarinus TaxID=1844966 RepID=A0ABD2QNG4_9PLAT
MSLLSWLDEAFNGPESCKSLFRNNPYNVLFARMCYLMLSVSNQKPPDSYPQQKWHLIWEQAATWFETNSIGCYLNPESALVGDIYLRCATRLILLMEKTDCPSPHMIEQALCYFKKAQCIYEPVASIYPLHYSRLEKVQSYLGS